MSQEMSATRDTPQPKRSRMQASSAAGKMFHGSWTSAFEILDGIFAKNKELARNTVHHMTNQLESISTLMKSVPIMTAVSGSGSDENTSTSYISCALKRSENHSKQECSRNSWTSKPSIPIVYLYAISGTDKTRNAARQIENELGAPSSLTKPALSMTAASGSVSDSNDRKYWLLEAEGDGLAVIGDFKYINGSPHIVMNVDNDTDEPITSFSIELEHYFYAFTRSLHVPIHAKSYIDETFEMIVSVQKHRRQLLNSLDTMKVTVRYNNASRDFTVHMPFKLISQNSGYCSRSEYAIRCREIPTSTSGAMVKKVLKDVNRDNLITKTAENNIFTTGRYDEDGMTAVWQSYRLPNDVWVLLEWKIHSNDEAVLTVKSESVDFSFKTFDIIEKIIRS